MHFNLARCLTWSGYNYTKKTKVFQKSWWNGEKRNLAVYVALLFLSSCYSKHIYTQCLKIIKLCACKNSRSLMILGYVETAELINAKLKLNK